MSPARRRRCIDQVKEVLEVSERRVCRVLGQHRSTQRTVGLTINDRSRDIRVAEPIHDPALAKLVSIVRRLTKQHTVRR